MKRKAYIFRFLPLTLSVAACLPVLAQQIPDSGPLLQENARTLPRPATSSANIPLRTAPPAQQAQAGGVQVTLRAVTLTGNTRISSADLLSVLGPVAGKTFNFAGLSALAARISAFYQQAGYPFARAYLPQQDLSSGELHIVVLEGHYGVVDANGEPGFLSGARGFLSALPRGELIEARALERTTLLLNDQPGVITAPLMRPGDEVGTGDLLVEVKRDHRYKGEAGIDNYGTRATGRVRAHAGIDADSPFMLGDQLSTQVLYTQEHMWFGSLSYTAPIGYSGLRGRASYTHSFYELAGSFAALGAHGTADVASLGVTYPLIRSQVRNVTLAASLDHKRLHDRQDATSTASNKASSVVPVSVSFDLRDQFIHAGITYGALSWVHGHLGLDAASQGTDGASAHTAGSFSKLNLDLARVQSLNARVDLFARLSVQRAPQNLDPSEKLGIGGVNGVRAYPNGEGYGDSGWVVQTEARYAVGALVPYVFFDAGRVRLSESAWVKGANDRKLAGTGIGARYTSDAWTGSITVARRTSGGSSQSDPDAHTPTILANVTYRF